MMMEDTKMEGIQIHEISQQMFQNLGNLKEWEETIVQPGEAVKAHKHDFNAMYIIDGVAEVFSNGKTVELPKRAAVFIPKGVEHSWNGVAKDKEKGIVGHFHSGHGVHKIVGQYN
jgi:quercetin dioxygenase-like cupin family protein